MTTRVSRGPQPEAVAVVRPWWWQAVALRAQGLAYPEIAAACARTVSSVRRVLSSAWGRAQTRELSARVTETRLAEAVDPVVKFQAKGGRMADIMLQAAEDERQPLKRAIIAEKNLALGGWVAVQKSLSVTLDAKLRDRDAVPDHVLEAFANGGEVPDVLRPLLLTPDADESSAD